MVNRGYSSSSAMYAAYKRFERESLERGLEGEEEGDALHILYFGDHDPSGLDMVRDIKDRFMDFGMNISVHPIALTTAQVKQYNPPPNPAKMSDPRADWYVSKFGKVSWELDALPPQVLQGLVKGAIDSLWDFDVYQEVLDREKEDIEKLKNFQRLSESMEENDDETQD